MVINNNELEFKGQTLQEYLEWKYPEKEDKEGVRGIETWEINNAREEAGLTEILEGGELDLREFKNVEKANVGGEDLKTPLTKLNIEGLVNLAELFCFHNNLTSLDVSGCVNNLAELFCNDNNLTSLDVSQNVNLTYLDCSCNNLTSIDFLNQLPNPEKLLKLGLANNNIEPTNLEFLRPFVNLTEKLTLGNDIPKKYNNNIYNRFYGSLEPLKNMTKLSGLCIDGTDVEEGIEYLPVSISKDYFNCFPQLPNQKVAKIQDQLRPFNYDLEAWQLANPAKMLKVWKEKCQDKNWLIKQLATKIQGVKQELKTTQEQEADKTAKITRLESKLKLLQETHDKLKSELEKEQQQHNQTKTNFQSQLRDLATILFPSNHDLSNLSFSVLKDQAQKVKEKKTAQEQQITNLQEALVEEKKHRDRNYESARQGELRVKEKNEELKLAQEKTNKLEQTITSQQATITNLQGQIEVKKTELQQAKTQSNQLSSELETTKEKNQSYLENAKLKEEIINDNNQQIKHLESQLQTSQTELEQSKTHTNQTIIKLQEQIEVKVKELKNQDQTLIKLHAEQEKVLQELTTKLGQANQQLIQLSTQTQTIKELKLQLLQLERTKSTELKEFKDQVKEKLTQIKTTHQKVMSVFKSA